MRLMKTRQDNLPDISLLWSKYDYNPVTGRLISKHLSKPLSITPRLRNHYYTLSWLVNGNKQYYSTTIGRIVIAWVTGKWPTEEVDHINRDTADNRLHNLRIVSSRINACNRSSFKGGITQQRNGKWRTRIRIDGKQVSLGTYESKEEAIAIYTKASELV